MRDGGLEAKQADKRRDKGRLRAQSRHCDHASDTKQHTIYQIVVKQGKIYQEEYKGRKRGLT